METKIKSKLTENEKISLMLLTGCPVNQKHPVTLSKAVFKKMCLRHQRNSRVISKRGKLIDPLDSKKKKNMMQHKRKSIICLNCKIGKQVRGNQRFEPPFNITFDDFGATEKKNKMAPKVQATRKLTKENIKHIRKMYQDGYTISAILIRYNMVSRSTISNVVNRVSWKHI